MGGASSRFHETDWDIVDGGLKEASETIDGLEPTKYHSILTLKKQNIVSQREFQVSNQDDGEVLYCTKPIEGTTKNFDLYKGETKLFCVQTDALRNKWSIYTYQPNWEGQLADPNAKGDVPLYRKACILVTWNKYNGEVRHFVTPSPAAAEAETAKETKEGDWEDPSMGILNMDQEPSLRVEEIKSITGQFQSYIPQMSLLDSALHPPLVGFWVWEHTKNCHQLKMHLAKGTDIALHSVVAIATNLVSVEKHHDE